MENDRVGVVLFCGLMLLVLLNGCGRTSPSGTTSSKEPPSPGAVVNLNYEGEAIVLQFPDALYNHSGSDRKADLLETGDDRNALGFGIAPEMKNNVPSFDRESYGSLVGKELLATGYTSEFGTPRINLPKAGEHRVTGGKFVPEKTERYKYQQGKASALLSGSIVLELESRGVVKSCAGTMEIRFISYY